MDFIRKNFSKTGLIASASLLLPLVAGAQTLTNIDTTAKNFGGLVNNAITVLIGVAILLFIWGLVKFIWNAGNEEAKEEGKRIMIWGIIAIFVMVSVWGIVSFLQGSFGVVGQTDFQEPVTVTIPI